VAKSTGVILAVGAVTVFNDVILNNEELDMRVPIATAFGAMVFSLLEKANQPIAVGVAWVALLTVLLARIDPKKPAPVETLLAMWNKGR
jgi:hypothetical protein